MNEDKFTAIADEIARLTGSDREEMSLKTRVYHDAGLSGIDYRDFLVWFSNRYGVDLAGLEMSKVSPGEGSALGSLWPKRYLELTIEDFIRLAEASSWKASGLADRVGRK